MKKEDRDNYLYQKKCLLVLLFLFYKNDIRYDAITLRSFGFHFDPQCNFKAIVHSKKDHIHKYSIFIYLSMFGINYENADVMGRVNFIRVKRISNNEFYSPEASLNIYFDGVQFHALGYLEGQFIDHLYKRKGDLVTDELLYHLSNDFKDESYNSSAPSFILWLLRLYTCKLHTDLVIGAGINEEYGAKNWNGLIEALNNDFYKGDYKFANDIKHYVGKELFTSSMVLNFVSIIILPFYLSLKPIFCKHFKGNS